MFLKLGSILFIGKKPLVRYKGKLEKADLALHLGIATYLSAHLPVGSTILDFGAGTGSLSHRLVDAGYKVLSVDIESIPFFHGSNIATLDFNNQKACAAFRENHKDCFDCVLGIEVIEHIEDQNRYIADLSSMLKPGGIILLTTPNISSWLSRMIFLLTGRHHQFGSSDLSYGHINPVADWQINRLLANNGFTDITTFPLGTLPLIYASSLPYLLLSLLAIVIRPFQRGRLSGWCLGFSAIKI